MTELRHLQMVILSIMKDIDDLCKRNNIDYYLLGGSAIGAIRHHGFIPWDDDLDIIMTNENYKKFVNVCRSQLDKDKYYFQEGLKDWSLYFSKIKLKGTVLQEKGHSELEQNNGIFVDIFKLDNVPSSHLLARWQYFCAKYYLCYQLSLQNYSSTTFKKKLMIYLSFPLKYSWLRTFMRNQVERYNNQFTEYLGFFYGRTKYKTAITPRSVYGKPLRIPFEDTNLPVPEHYHEYLTQMFGDYMKLPPEEQRVGLHLISVDFGKY